MKEGGQGFFSLIGRNLPIQVKEQKEKPLKGGPEKGGVQKPWEKKDQKSALQDLPERESQLGAFEKGTSKEGNSEKMRKGPATNVAVTTLVMVPKAANRGNRWYPSNPRMAL